MTSTVRVLAPAKVNLYLHIVGRRADGYHLLDSLVAFVDVCDEVIAVPAESFSLRIEGPYAGPLQVEDENLVLRAARGLAEICDVSEGAALTLVKNLPVAAGLGGGSSDAAATLEALTALWGVTPDADRVARLAVSLGADVPVCRFGATALMSGIGEVLESAPALPPCGVVLANPNRPLSTADVFAARHGGYSTPDPPAISFDTTDALAKSLAARRNDLYEAAAGLMPDVGRIIAALEANGTCLLARLSGSGPSCFGIYADADAAIRAAERVASDHPEWWVRPGLFIDRPGAGPGQ